MKFLVDAQLPRRLAHWLAGEGHDVVHTLDLPKGNRTSDSEICAVADGQARVVVTKDDDFVYSFMAQARPQRLLLVSTGNIGNADLLALFQEQMVTVSKSFTDCRFVELTSEAVISHE